MILTGVFRVGRDAELKEGKNGAYMVVNCVYNVGNRKDEKSQWVQATLFGKLAEAIAPYVTKGVQFSAVIEDVFVDLYDKKDGTQGASLRGRISSIELVGGRQSNDGEEPVAKAKPKPKAAPIDDDEIPF